MELCALFGAGAACVAGYNPAKAGDVEWNCVLCLLPVLPVSPDTIRLERVRWSGIVQLHGLWLGGLKPPGRVGTGYKPAPGVPVLPDSIRLER